MAPVAAAVDSGVASGEVAQTAAVVDSVTSGDVAPVAVVDTPRKRLLDTGSTQHFGLLCHRICRFLAGVPSVLVVGGPTGCGKLTSVQHCVAGADRGLVEIVNESAAATGIVSKIRRSGSMLSSTGSCIPSVIVVTGADGLQSGAADLLNCGRSCKKHVIIVVNNPTVFGTLPLAELYRCGRSPWSCDALRAALDAIPGSDLLTVQEKGVMMRTCNNRRQLQHAAEMLIGVKKLGCTDSATLHSLVDTPVHQWYNTLSIMQGASIPTAQHDMNWIGGSYLAGMQSTALEAAAEFASTLTVADMLSDDCEFSDSYSALVLQSSMPLVAHRDGLHIEKIKLDLPPPCKRARYSFALQTDAI